VRTVAPAKINWTLEVLGKREDGYHEIRSVMQTIDLCDIVDAWREPDARPIERPANVTEGAPWLAVRSSPVSVYWRGDYDMQEPGEGDDPWTAAACRAASLLDPTDVLGAGVEVTKRIPVASGLGGGSSDAAAALRSLDRLWGLSLSRERLGGIAAELGSDVAFFLYGGTALAEGRGERVIPLPDLRESWIVVLAPPIRLEEKTKRMYEAVSADHFTDGSRTEELSRSLNNGKAVTNESLFNAFERLAYKTFEGLDGYREALRSAGANSVHLAGAGPTLFALAESEAAAREIADRVEAPRAKVFVVQTLGAAEATAVTD
jgi:4-diphosphocytidyl-2-C-methyl-D-erythritol kinase